jgi:hypothetical protein
VDLVRTDISEERICSIIKVTRIGKLGTTLEVTRVHVAVEQYTGCFIRAFFDKYLQQESPYVSIIYFVITLCNVSQCSPFRLPDKTSLGIVSIFSPLSSRVPYMLSTYVYPPISCELICTFLLLLQLPQHRASFLIFCIQ